MSSGLMSTEKGGEQTQYEAEYTDQIPPKKSSGQLGCASSTSTTDPNKTDAAAARHAQRGEQTAENIRYGQAISEGGMSGFTAGQAGEATQEGYGQVDDREEAKGGGGDAAQDRRAAGYGGEQDMDREVGG